jgi:hypothetical protein
VPGGHLKIPKIVPTGKDASMFLEPSIGSKNATYSPHSNAVSPYDFESHG